MMSNGRKRNSKIDSIYRTSLSPSSSFFLSMRFGLDFSLFAMTLNTKLFDEAAITNRSDYSIIFFCHFPILLSNHYLRLIEMNRLTQFNFISKHIKLHMKITHIFYSLLYIYHFNISTWTNEQSN